MMGTEIVIVVLGVENPASSGGTVIVPMKPLITVMLLMPIGVGRLVPDPANDEGAGNSVERA